MENKYLQQLYTLRDQVALDTGDEQVLRIDPTTKTPFVYVNRRDGVLLFAGTATPDNYLEFYRTIQDFIRSPSLDAEAFVVYFRVNYINSSSCQGLLNLLKSLNLLFLEGMKMNILWFQEENNPDDYTDGEDWQYMVKIPFDIIELNNEETEELDTFIRQL